MVYGCPHLCLLTVSFTIYFCQKHSDSFVMSETVFVSEHDQKHSNAFDILV